MKRYRLRPAAEADLEAIWDYSVETWGRGQAERYLGAVFDRLVALSAGRLPARGASDVRPGYLKCSAGLHMIYFTRAADGSIDVIRILHQRMDVSGRLFPH